MFHPRPNPSSPKQNKSPTHHSILQNNICFSIHPPPPKVTISSLCIFFTSKSSPYCATGCRCGQKLVMKHLGFAGTCMFFFINRMKRAWLVGIDTDIFLQIYIYKYIYIQISINIYIYRDINMQLSIHLISSPSKLIDLGEWNPNWIIKTTHIYDVFFGALIERNVSSNRTPCPLELGDLNSCHVIPLNQGRC